MVKGPADRQQRGHGNPEGMLDELTIRRVLRSEDPDGLLREVMRAVDPGPGNRVVRGSLYRTESSGLLRLVASAGMSEAWRERNHVVPLDADLPVARAVRHHEPVHSATAPADASVAAVIPFVVYPLLLGSRCLGVVSFNVVDLVDDSAAEDPAAAAGAADGLAAALGMTDEAGRRALFTLVSLCAHRFDELVPQNGTAAHDESRRALRPRPLPPLPPLAGSRTTMLEMAMSNAGIGSYDWDFDSHKVFWDERLCHMFGIPPSEFDHRIETFYAAVHPADRHRVDSALADSRRTGRYAVRYRFMRRNDGAVRWLDTESRIIFDTEGEPRGMVGIARDCTEEQTRDEQRQARDDFTTNVTRALTAASSTDDIVEAVAGTVLPALSADRMAIFLRSDADVMQLVGYQGFDDEQVMRLRQAGRINPDILAVASLIAGEPLFIGSREEFHARFGAVWPTLSPGLHAMVLLPLSTRDGLVGVCVIVFDRPRAFTSDEKVLVTGFAGTLAQSLARARHFDERRAQLRELQSLMLPSSLPPLPGLDVLVRYWPGSNGLAVGGDWYDVLPMPDGRVALAIGDVQGHSARAAAVMGQLRVAMRTHAADGHELSALMSAANQSLCDMDTDLFATCCLVDIDPGSGTLRMVRAGHTHPMVLSPEGLISSLTGPGSPPLGLFAYEDDDYPVTEAVLPAGATLLLYTDGLVEVPGMDYDDGVAELAEHLAFCAGTADAPGGLLDLDELAERVIAPVAVSPSHTDDIAALLVRRRPEPTGSGAGTVAGSDSDSEPWTGTGTTG